MNLVRTSVSQTAIHMRYANHSDPVKADEWVDFQVRLDSLKRPGRTDLALTEPEIEALAELHRVALRYAQAVLGSEIERIRGLANRSF